MNTLLPKRRIKVPNQLAVVAAVLLSVASIPGFVKLSESDQPTAQAEIPAANQGEAASTDPASKKRKLTLSSLLFGQG